MDSELNEIERLKLMVIELERQKKEKEDNDKRCSLEYNFSIINELLSDRKTAIKNNSYPKSVPLARYYDEQLVKHLEATYNILRIMEDRMQKMEQNCK